MVCNSLGILWPESRIRLLVHYACPLSSLCKLIWNRWTCIKCCQIFYGESVSRTKSVQYINYILWNKWSCFHLSFDDCGSICTSFHHHHRILNMDHFSLLRVRSWSSGSHCNTCYVNILYHMFMWNIFWVQFYHNIIWKTFQTFFSKRSLAFWMSPCLQRLQSGLALREWHHHD